MLHDTYPVFFNFGDQVGIVHHRITTFFVILNNFGLLFSPKARHSFILVSSEGPSLSRYDDFICSCFTVKHRNS